jgi:hypothetical protein
MLEYFTTNEPDPSHCSPNSCFAAFLTVSLVHELRCETGQTCAINAQVHATKSRWNFLQWTHLIHPIGPQTHVLERLWLFRCCTNFSAKRVELVPFMQIFVQQSHIGIFRDKRTLSSPLDPKLKFWGVSRGFIPSQKSRQNGPKWWN